MVFQLRNSSCYFYSFTSFSCLMYLLCHFCPLLHLHLCLCFQHPCHHHHNIQVSAFIFQPSMCNPRSQTLICLQTRLHYQTSHNILIDGVLEVEVICIQLFQSLCQHSICQRRVFPSPLCPVLRLHPFQMVGYPVVLNPPRVRLICVFMTQVSESNKNISCITTL